MLKSVADALLDILKNHKKKIGFFLASISFCFLLTFPYDDLSDFITLQVTRASQSQVYLQFDGLSFGLMPALGIRMNNVLIESVYAPSLAVKSLGFAPHLFGLVTGSPGGVLKASDFFKGDIRLDFGRSNQLKMEEGSEMGLNLDLSHLSLGDLSRYLKDSSEFPLSMEGVTQVSSKVFVDPSFKEPPKGEVTLVIKGFEIPASQIPLNVSGANMSFPFPALKLSEVKLRGKLNDRRLLIEEGQIGKAGNDLSGTITGDVVVDVLPGGQIRLGGYDLMINLNINDSLRGQLAGILGFVDSFQSIGDRYKFDSLNGVRYTFRINAKSMSAIPRVTAN